ncbi:hypothetical protein TNCV_3898161 [Trichonephila clavipes]|nr:hypothetical protein TNCV_3898161 [Trichonephila clavipes]
MESVKYTLPPREVATVAEWYRYRTVACLVTSSSPVPLKSRHVGQRCILNLSRAETFSRWIGSLGERYSGSERTDLHVQFGALAGQIYRDVILEQHVRLFCESMGAEIVFMVDNVRPHSTNRRTSPVETGQHSHHT